MAREYMISSTFGGTTLQIDEDGESEEVKLQASTDEGQKREAERIINDRYYHQDPFPGCHWQPMNPNGWRTSDHDLR